MTTTVPTRGGPALPVTIKTDHKAQGRVAISVYGFANEADAVAAGFKAQAGPAMPIYIVTAAELANGTFVQEADPKATPIYTAPAGMATEGDYATPVILAGGSLSSVSTPSSLLTGLAAYYKLSNLTDSSGNGSTLTNSGAATFVAGKVGNAANFVAASSQFLYCNSNTHLQLGPIDWTIACWVYLPNKATYRMIVTKDTDTKREYTLVYNVIAKVFEIEIFDVDTIQVNGRATTFGEPAINTWYFLCVRHDAIAHTVGISVNGGTEDVTPIGKALDSAGAARFEIGARQYPSSEFYMDGMIDEVGIWKRKLTAAEIAMLYNDGGGTTYPFELAAPTAINILAIGDSKTAGGEWVRDLIGLVGYPNVVNAAPPIYAVSGWRTSNAYAGFDAMLAAATDTPTYIINALGANDLADWPIDETTWKSQTRYMMNAARAKWPNVQWYQIIAWQRSSDGTPADTLAQWVADVVAEEPTWRHVGIDERLILKPPDNGNTYTTDGTHPTEAGWMLEAQAWKLLLGY